MSSNTKFLRSLKTIQTNFRKKSQRFEESFVISTFFLFFGFMCGNLFGTFLAFFRNYIHWDGAIIALILLVIEWVNYLNFVILNKRKLIDPSPIVSKNKSRISSFLLQVGLLIPRFMDLIWRLIDPETKNRVTFKTRWNRFFKTAFVFLQRKRNATIRLLNFYKLGLLLGFFIDAFKVGS